jgi:hypothetical protein
MGTGYPSSTFFNNICNVQEKVEKKSDSNIEKKCKNCKFWKILCLPFGHCTNEDVKKLVQSEDLYCAVQYHVDFLCKFYLKKEEMIENLKKLEEESKFFVTIKIGKKEYEAKIDFYKYKILPGIELYKIEEREIKFVEDGLKELFIDYFSSNSEIEVVELNKWHKKEGYIIERQNLYNVKIIEMGEDNAIILPDYCEYNFV